MINNIKISKASLLTNVLIKKKCSLNLEELLDDVNGSYIRSGHSG